jgi:uncharacterized protein
MQHKLYELFIADQRVRGLSSGLSAATRRLEAQQAKLDQFNQQRVELAQQHKQLQVQASTFEHQSRDSQARVEHLRQQMNSVKTNKEYSALLVEMNTLKIEKEKLEEQALQQLERVEAVAKEIQEADQKIVVQQKLVQGAAAEVQARRDEVAQELTEATAHRKEAASKLPAEILEIYQRAANTHEGEAMAEVIEENRRGMEYTCGGCYMGIPIELLNALLRNDDRPVICSSCSRILYVQEELRVAFSSKAAAGAR